MSGCSESSSECSESSSVLDFNEESKYVLEMEHEHVQVNDAYDLRDLGNDWIPYSDEPIADKEWLLQYNKEQEEKENQEEEFKRRLDGTISLDSW